MKHEIHDLCDQAHRPNTGENPHAEILALPPASFREPDRWIAENVNAETRPSMFRTLSDLLQNNLDKPSNDEPIATLLQKVSRPTSIQRLLVGESSRFFRFGPLILPAIPAGVQYARRVRTIARELIGSSDLTMAEPDSDLGRMLESVKLAGESKGRLLEHARNRTSERTSERTRENGPGVLGFRLGFQFNARTISLIPKGAKLPPALLSRTEGYEIEDPLELMNECDMCSEGTADFLDDFGLTYAREPYECGECGSACDGEGGGRIEQIEPFTLTGEMIEQIDRQGFGDKLREYVSYYEADSVSTLLDSCDDAEIRERVRPDAENGILYDTESWDFSPDFESLEGMQDCSRTEALRAGALFGGIASEYERARILPPFGGTLTLVEKGLAREQERIAFCWDPVEGTLSSVLGGGLMLCINARTGSARLRTTDRAFALSGSHSSVSSKGRDYILDLPSESGGKRAELMLQLEQARVEI